MKKLTPTATLVAVLLLAGSAFGQAPAPPAPPAAPATKADLAELEARLNARFDGLERRLANTEAESLRNRDELRTLSGRVDAALSKPVQVNVNVTNTNNSSARNSNVSQNLNSASSSSRSGSYYRAPSGYWAPGRIVHMYDFCGRYAGSYREPNVWVPY